VPPPATAPPPEDTGYEPPGTPPIDIDYPDTTPNLPADDDDEDDYTAYEPPSTPQLPDPVPIDPEPIPPDVTPPDAYEPPNLEPLPPQPPADDYILYEPPQMPPQLPQEDFKPIPQPPTYDYPYDQYEPPVYINEPADPEPTLPDSDDIKTNQPEPDPQPDGSTRGTGDPDDDVVRGEEAGNRRRKRPGRAGEGRTIMGSATNYTPTKSVQRKTLLGS
jgi:hypothetical protein